MSGQESKLLITDRISDQRSHTEDIKVASLKNACMFLKVDPRISSCMLRPIGQLQAIYMRKCTGLVARHEIRTQKQDRLVKDVLRQSF